MKRTTEQAKRFDWELARQRLARAVAPDSLQLTPERARAVLEERARLLARVPAQATRAAEVIEVVTFGVAGERYALAASSVREVVRFIEPTPVPGTPDFLAGIINLRGEIVAVFDPRPFFGLSRDGEAKPARLVVLGDDGVEFALLADTVHEVLLLRLEDILPPPDAATGPGREYLRGVMADALIVLDGVKLLQDRRLLIDVGEEAIPASQGEGP